MSAAEGDEKPPRFAVRSLSDTDLRSDLREGRGDEGWQAACSEEAKRRGLRVHAA